MKAYAQRQFARSDFRTEGYELNNIEGSFTGTLVFKKWGKKCNIIAYVEADDGRKIVCTAFQKPDNYLGIQDIEIGTKVELTYGRTNRGTIRLNAVRTM